MAKYLGIATESRKMFNNMIFFSSKPSNEVKGEMRYIWRLIRKGFKIKEVYFETLHFILH